MLFYIGIVYIRVGNDRMRTEDISLLITAIRNGSFSKAGQEFGLSQSAVSKRIKALENELGGTLLDRDSSGVVRLTSLGNSLFRDLEKIMSLAKRVEMKRSRSINTVRIAACTGFDLTMLTNLIDKFEGIGFTVSAKIMSSIEVKLQLEENRCEVGIVGFANHESRIFSKAAYSEQIVLAGVDRIELRDLADIYTLPLILHQKGSGLREFVNMALESLGIDIGRLIIKYEVGYEDFSVAACKRGYGYAFISERHLDDSIHPVWGTGVKQLLRSFWYLSKDIELLDIM